MAHQELDFNRRIHGLEKTHLRLSRGHATYMRPDGLLVAAPHQVRSGRPLMVIPLILASFFVFKVFLMVTVGATTYDDRVMRLAQGNVAEAAGAWAMQSDPVTEFFAFEVIQLLR